MTRPRFFAALLAGVLFFAFISSARADICTYVANGSPQNITGPDGVCKKVTNGNGSFTVCAPAGSGSTSAEWQSFYGHPPSGVTLAACPLASCSSPCGTIASGSSCTAYSTSTVSCGTSCASQSRLCTNGVLSGSYAYASCSLACAGDCYSSYCYYPASNKTCTTACSTHGGCVAAGMTYSVGSAARCYGIVNTVEGTSISTATTGTGFDYGCYTIPSKSYLTIYYTTPIDCSANLGNAAATTMCACAN